MTIRRVDGLTWAAARDGLAHAAPTGSTRTLCGDRPIPERNAWPIGHYCAPCTAIADGLKAEYTQRRKEARIAKAR